MFLGIEIGGTKLQLGVGQADGQLAALERLDVVPSDGAEGILRAIAETGPALIQRYQARRVGIGFGGPVDRDTGCVTTSHQIVGWDSFPLRSWCEQKLGIPVVLGNDCDSAALGEALFGAGQGSRRVFFVTVGTGIGGGFVVDGEIDGTERAAIAEIGHLRPGPNHRRADETVESVSSGWGIAALARQRVEGWIAQSLPGLPPQAPKQSPAEIRQHLQSLAEMDREFEAELLLRCDGDLDGLTAKMIGQAAEEGNEVARQVVMHAVETLGWAIAQVVTLLAPQVVVVGGGVSLLGNSLFLEPLRRAAEAFVFPPLIGTYRIAPAALGEEVVVHGALALCRDD